MSSGAKFVITLLIAAIVAFFLLDGWPPWNGNGDDGEVSLTSLERLVERGDTAGEHEVPVGSTEPVSGGDTVRLGGEGEATLDYSRFVRVRLFRDTHLRAIGEFNPDEPEARMRVEQATLVASVLTPEEAERLVSVDIDTGVATIRVVGTELFVHVEPATSATWVIVADGAVRVEGAGAEVSLVAGTQTWVEPGAPPVGPFPATREAVGDRFPSISELTGGALSDDDWLSSDAPPADVSIPEIDLFEFRAVRIEGETTQRVARVEVVASDPGSGVAEIVIQVDGDVLRTCPAASCDVTVDPLTTGEHEAEILVRDEAGNVARALRTLVVEPPEDIDDEPPVAVISSPRDIGDLVALANSFEVFLDAGMSFDPDGSDLSYAWTVERVGDAVALLLDPVEQGTVEFDADLSCGSQWTYRFTLTVVDANGMSDTASVDIFYPIIC